MNTFFRGWFLKDLKGRVVQWLTLKASLWLAKFMGMRIGSGLQQDRVWGAMVTFNSFDRRFHCHLLIRTRWNGRNKRLTNSSDEGSQLTTDLTWPQPQRDPHATQLTLTSQETGRASQTPPNTVAKFNICWLLMGVSWQQWSSQGVPTTDLCTCTVPLQR